MINADDYAYMAQALRLAVRGLYTATPNPRVGCVIVRDGQVVGEGFHERVGEPHAEVHALNAAGAKARNATVYVTLEPCSHHGRTPPCADALIAAGVARVVAAMQDPNPQVAGQGLDRLRAAGVAVECGVLEHEARELNIGFVSRMTRGRPWLRVKIAASLDGRTALANGVSQWISSEAARIDAHVWRARSCAVLTGGGTVLADDPQLTVRHVATPRQPLRVVADSELRISPQAKVLAGGQAVVFCATSAVGKRRAIAQSGAEVVELAGPDGKVELHLMLQELARRGINEALVEAGANFNGALLQAGLVDELIVYQAPHLLGAGARGMFTLPELTAMGQRVEMEMRDVRLVGKDMRLIARVKNV
ncbi:MAG: bifunctional diaminohydroxyphosphoribosylaminopyrimidine deaminase/5-amino-6-(5-phosphoribosylamino)uracil reductase RibD [Pseudomonadota bacterium]